MSTSIGRVEKTGGKLENAGSSVTRSFKNTHIRNTEVMRMQNPEIFHLLLFAIRNTDNSTT